MQSLAAPLHAEADLEVPEGSHSVLARLSRRISFAATLRDYLTFDLRTLGFTRLLLGFFLIGDLFHRGRFWFELYSSEGILPNTLSVLSPGEAFSIFNAFATRGELYVLFAMMLVTFVCLLAGYKTKLAQILALVFVTGMNSRVPLVETGGYVVQNLLLMWTCFLPLGDRFSVDAVIASMRRHPERSAEDLNDRSAERDARSRLPFLTLAGPAVLLQLAALYYVNFLHKTGDAYLNGKGVHYLMYCDRMVSPIIALVRDGVPNWLVIFLTHSAVVFEGVIGFALLSPFGRAWARRAAIFMICALHIAFGTMLVLGPFSWALCIFSTLLFSAADWGIASRTMRRARRARTVIFDAASARALMVCRILRRLDGFDLLTFRAGAAGSLGIALAGASRAPSIVAAEIIEALPLGPIAAIPLRAPLLRSIANAALGAIARRPPRPITEVAQLPVPSSPPNRAITIFRELGVAVMLIACANQLLVENPAIKQHIQVGQPEVLRLLIRKMRFFQGWFIMAPNPVMNDGIVVVDAITVDGRHVDPFSIHGAPYTLRAPNFDLFHAKSLGYPQVWYDYLVRMSTTKNERYRDAMKDYMFRLPQRTGHPEDALVSGDVYWIGDQSPRWNETESYDEVKEKLFSFVIPSAAGVSP